MTSQNSRPKLYPQVLTKPPYSIPISAPPSPTSTPPYRHPKATNTLHSLPSPDITTLPSLLNRSARLFGSSPALASRPLLATHVSSIQVPDGHGRTREKQNKLYELGAYSYTSYTELHANVQRAGAALRALGLERNDRVAIHAATSPFWFTVAHGVLAQSMTVVTAYDTLGEEGLGHSLAQTASSAMFVDPSLLSKVSRALERAPDTRIKAIVYSDAEAVKEDVLDAFRVTHPDIHLSSFDSFLETATRDTLPVPPSPTDLACIMYTSGSTGTPKGVPLSHRNIIAAIAGADSVIGTHMAPGERFLAYLPLAHILEFMLENAALYWGAVLGYANPRTLMGTSVLDGVGDLQAFGPGIMAGVPAVWEGVKKGVSGKVEGSGRLSRGLFWGAMRMKEGMLAWGLPGAGVLDYLVFDKVKKATGGNLRLVMNAGGPVAENTARFISFAICPLISGYGLTETAGMGAITNPLAWTASSLGGMPAAVEVKLVDVPDLGYLSSHDPPTGEVWIRGDAVVKEYIDNPEETAKAFQDGWFKTGDIGQFDAKGQLKIIDRKKNLVKTLNGEYIALEKLEALYRSVPVVNNICVYASPDHSRPIAIIEPVLPALKRIGMRMGEGDASYPVLCNSDKVRAAVVAELVAAGKQGGLQGIELIHSVVLSEDEWTPQNGLVTSAQKLNRRAVVDKFRKQIGDVL